MSWRGVLCLLALWLLCSPARAVQAEDPRIALQACDQEALLSWAESHPGELHGLLRPIIRRFLQAPQEEDRSRRQLSCAAQALGHLPAGILAARVIGWSPEDRELFQDLRADLRSGALPLDLALEESEALGCDALLLGEVGNLAQAAYRAGALPRAVELFGWVQASAEAADSLGQQAWAAGWLGNLHWEQGQFKQAAKQLAQAARLEEVLGDDGYRVRLYANLSRITGSGGDIERSMHWADRAEALARELGDPAALCEALLVQAGILIDLGQHEQALELSLQLSPESGTLVATGGTRVRVDMVAASALSDIGRFESALTFAERALAQATSTSVAQEMPLLAMEARLILGLLLGDLGRFEAGLAELKEVHAEAERRQDARGMAWSKKNEGWVRMASGDYAGAQQALEAARAYGAHSGEAFLEGICALGVAEALSLGAPAQANQARNRIERLLARSEVLGEQLGDLEFRWRAATVRGRMHTLAGEAQAALDAYAQAVADIERWRRRLATPSLLSHALRARTDPYRAAVAAAAELGLPEEALRYAELLHARGLLEQRAREGGPRQPSPEATTLRRRVALLAFEAREGTPGDAQRRELARAEAQLDARLLADELRLGLTVGPREAAKSPYGQEALEQSEVDVVLDYLVGPESSYVFTLDASGVRMRELALGGAALEQLIDRLRAPIERLARGEVDLAHMDLDLEAAEELHALLIEPALPPELPAGALIGVIPDGCLSKLPFGLLLIGGQPLAYDPARPFAYLAGYRFLGDEHPLVYLSSLASLAAPAAAPITQVSVLLPPEGLGVPQAPGELRAIERSFPGVEAIEEATPQDLVRSSARPRAGPHALHIPAHGRLDGASTRLILGAVQGPDQPAYLGAAQVEELELTASLIVLSACHSGEGAWMPGEGLLGLARAFLVAGGQQVIASLWAVDDGSSVAFMEALYAALAAGQPAHRALFQARRATRESLHPNMRHCWILRH